MADSSPENAFLRSMQAQIGAQATDGTAVNGHKATGNGQQIDSSDEYDTTQDAAINQASSHAETTGPEQAQVSSDPSETIGANVSRPNSNLNAITANSAPKASPTNKTTALAPSQSNTAATSIPVQKVRLPTDLIGILEDRIEQDSKGDIQAWTDLIKELKGRGKSEEVRKIYQRFLDTFPFCAEIWKEHLEFENEVNNRQGVENIFKKVLPELPSLDLWSEYLKHIRRHFNPATDLNWVKVVGPAFKAILNNVGVDKDAGQLWQDYISFIKDGPGTIGKQDWESQAKMDQLRAAFQEAVSIPTQSVEILWKDYSVFENGLNRLTGRQFLQKKSADYMSARSSYTELQNITRGLIRNPLPKLPPALGFDGDVEYMQQVDIWKRWVQWEKDDPLVLKLDNPKEYKKRIMYVYKQSLLALAFWPEMWFEAAEWCFDNDMASEGDGFLVQGIKFNPESSLLAFKRADRLEMTTTNGNDEDSKLKRGETVSEPYNKLLDALYDLIEKAIAREKKDIARIEAEFVNAPEPSNGVAKSDSEDDDDDDNDDEDNQKASKKVVEDKKQSQINALKAVSSIQTNLLSKSISHAWIAFMRAMQRMQGKGKMKTPIGGSRQVFRNSHKRGRVTSDVWLAAGLLEFHTSDTKAARNILDRGWKVFPEDENYTLRYIEFLTNIDDHTNARVVFEQTVSKLVAKPETIAKAKPLFVFFHRYESQYGELAQMQKLEARMKELFPNDPKLFAFSQRFTVNNFDPTAIRPIISPAAQTRPKMIVPPPMIMPTVEGLPSRQISPPQTVTSVPALPKLSSPKRSLEEAFGNNAFQPQKVARGESPNPMAAAALRRVDQPHVRTASSVVVPAAAPPPGPPPLPRDITFLLSIIPPASTYNTVPFKAEAMVKLIRDTFIPAGVEGLPISRNPGSGPGGYYR